MQYSAPAFLAGILLLVSQKKLLSLYVVLPAAALFCLVCRLIFRKYRRVMALYAFPAGYLWALAAVWPLIMHPLSHDLEGKSLLIRGYVASMPEETGFGQRFIFSPLSSDQMRLPNHIRLAWQNKTLNLHAGDFLQISVRLKRIHGVLNPGGIDIEAIRLAEGIGAQGYVVRSDNNRILSHVFYVGFVEQIRQAIRDKIHPLLPASETAHWLPALAIGDRENIPQKEWEILRRTGTNHLMAIAGLHLGFVSGGVYILVRRIWRFSGRLCLWMPAGPAAGWAALLAGVCYGALSGFLLPAKRACLMLAVSLTGVLLRRKLTPWHAWALALWGVLLLQPMSVLSAGFWLSFGSVALIIFGVSGRVAPKGLWWKTGRVQWVTALGLMPFSIWLFQQYSLVSFAANAIAIPWMGFLLLPLVVAGCFTAFISPVISKGCFWLAGHSLSALWAVLTAFSKLPWAAAPLIVTEPWRLLVAMVGVIVVLFPVGFPGRWLGFLWLLPLFCFNPSVPSRGTAVLTVLDVGQGLSAVVQTQNHVLVFDAGPRFGAGFDAGEQTVTPFLQSAGIHRIDRLVVSHGDNDHAGGVGALLSAFQVDQLITADPARLQWSAVYCLSGERWVWDEVTFAFLYPDTENLDAGNDSSCVLKVTAKNGRSLLLTGDIEKHAEKTLLEKNVDLRSDIIVVPHHGSKTSGERDFIAAVHPAWALFPLGYRNRFHFPHPTVLQRYRNMDAKIMTTADAGAIRVVLGDSNENPTGYRDSHGHFWN